MQATAHDIARPAGAAPSSPTSATPALDALQHWRASFPMVEAWLGAGVPVAVALRRLGLTLWTDKRLDAASQVLRDAAAADPTNVATWLDLGFCLHALGQARAALEAFHRATEASPGHARAWLAVGLTAKETGDPQRAQEALARALALDGSLDDAAYALGLIHFEARRYLEAAGYWQDLSARGYKTGFIRVGLGQCMFFLGEFGAAAQSLSAHLADHPDDEAIARRYALVCFLDSAVLGGPEAACAAYAAAAGRYAEPIEKIARAGFLLLAAYGHAQAALALAEAFAKPDETDPIRDHHVAALKGETAAKAPSGYVTAYFDRFAETFDDQMAVLGYKAPERLAALLDDVGAKTPRALDLGCGSGAAGPHLRRRCHQLIGVDLSANMIEKARARSLYDSLVRADMVEFLAAHPGSFDLIFAADSLIYLGDLEPLLEAVAQALVPGGYLAVTLETTTQATYILQSSGRFAHDPETFLARAAARFGFRARQKAFLRREANYELYGELIVLERGAS